MSAMTHGPRIPGFSWLRRKRGLFCCPGFEILVGNAGKDSLSALIAHNGKRVIFELQFRAVSADEEGAFLQSGLQSSYEGHVKLVSSMCGRYCPYCGTRLASLIKFSNYKAFLSLAEKHKPFSLCGRP
jgi:hypothetical protein